MWRAPCPRPWRLSATTYWWSVPGTRPWRPRRCGSATPPCHSMATSNMSVSAPSNATVSATSLSATTPSSATASMASPTMSNAFACSRARCRRQPTWLGFDLTWCTPTTGTAATSPWYSSTAGTCPRAFPTCRPSTPFTIFSSRAFRASRRQPIGCGSRAPSRTGT